MYHQPVLLQEVLDFIPENPKLIVDGTLWHWWHTLEMIKQFQTQYPDSSIQFLWLDLDKKMLDKAQGILSEKIESQIQILDLLHTSYAKIDEILDTKKADYILIDIGVNLEHFKDWERGFSIKKNADLDMRYDQTAEKSAFTIINKYSPTDLSKMFQDYGDFAEHKADELAKTITKERRNSPVKDTFWLKTILNSCGLWEKAAAVIFQAIRIETNDELKNLKQFLEKFPNCLTSGWRCTIISYHSGEDRLVKNRFKELGATEEFKLVTKKAVQPHYTEVQKNRASRSAKLRVIEKI